MEKAFDHVNRNFILYVLARSGFGEKWCAWILYWYFYNSLLYLGEWFTSGFLQLLSWFETKGPTISITFILVMKALSKMILSFGEGDFLNGFSMGSGEYGHNDISHLPFANNTSSFVEQV